MLRIKCNRHDAIYNEYKLVNHVANSQCYFSYLI